MRRFFEGTQHAQLYSRFRPDPPVSLITRLLTPLLGGDPAPVGSPPPLDQAVDVGCGTGQNTRCIAPYFRSVLATDVSPAQIEEARRTNQLSNVQFAVSSAEEIPLPAGSVQLVTASQCCHFFPDLPAFFRQADRVLKPGGVLAIYGYDLPKVYRRDQQPWQRMCDVVTNTYRATDGYWSPAQGEVERRYNDQRFQLPYRPQTREEQHYTEKQLSLEELVGEMSTWSGFQTMVKQCGEERGRQVLQQAHDDFLSVLTEEGEEPETAVLPVRFQYFLLMAQKPSGETK